MKTLLLIALLFLGSLGVGYLMKSGRLPFLAQKDRWAIAIYKGDSPLQFRPAQAGPILTAQSVTDVPAEFVADPFMLRTENQWQMFFEILNSRTGQGDIGLAVSEDGLNWFYSGIVLDEAFHLSYPYVFAWEGNYYMIPESLEEEDVRLYRAEDFPHRWILQEILMAGVRLADSSVFRHNNRWWLLAKSRNHTLRLFLAEELAGPWREHPQSPIVRDEPMSARPGGRVVDENGRLIRYAQSGVPHYGREVLAFEITELTPAAYRERPLGRVLTASGEGWNRDGMHHIDPHRTEDGGWVACVDGFEKYWTLDWQWK